MSFGEQLKHFRIINKYTQDALAEAIGIPESLSKIINDWEIGISEPSFEYLRKICWELEVPADELLEISKL